ncbi:MAG: hypothetical protein ACI4EN_06270 [Butyrivibrio sp.]
MLFFSTKIKNMLMRKGMVLSPASPPDPKNRTCLEKGASYAAVRPVGSLTVEASLVLPVFIAAIICLIFFIQIIRIQVHIQKALYNQTLSVAGYAYYVNEADMVSVAENFLEAEYVKAQIIKELGEDFFDSYYFVNGSKGFILNFSGINNEGIIDAALQYQIKIPFDIFGIGKLNFVARARCRAWTGKEDGRMEWDNEMVYVTSGGSVYHTDRNCTYIKTDIMSCKYEQISEIRNNSGGIYYPCSLCCGKSDYGGHTVFYTKYGSRYHALQMCTNLKHNVFSIEKSKAENKYRICSKCGEGG